MPKFILINEDLNLKKEKWLRDQKTEFDRVLGSVVILDYFIVKNSKLERKGVVEINDGDINKFKIFDHIIYDNKTDVPNMMTSDTFWDKFTSDEKTLFLQSEDSIVMRFKLDLQIRSIWNVNNQELIDGLAYLELISILGEGRANEVLNLG